VSVVPPHNFPQGKWKAGKTPRVKKGKVNNLHRASIAEVCFTDTFETDDSTYKYGQAVVEYRSRFGDIFPIRTRKKVGWAIGEFCCRHFVPLILVRDNIAENVGGSMDEECHRRGIKSAFSCPYTPQQDYAEGYLGRVTAMASFAMVLAGAPVFMWRWAIVCAVFINNITAAYYRKEKVWATPWELLHDEPFPDSSIVVPFGCAALVLLNKDEQSKFKGKCAMMIFVHYALNHPLYTYALFSPRSKRVVYRQDVIFLPNVFPMREARTRMGLEPDGESVIAYRSPQLQGQTKDDETSFDDWKDSDPIPAYQDHVNGYSLVSPQDDTSLPSDERDNVPFQKPSHPAFGPQSVVKVHVPWGEQLSGKQEGDSLDEQKGAGKMGRETTDGDSEKKEELSLTRPKRTRRKVTASSKETKRRPAGERWYYELVPKTTLVAQLRDNPAEIVGERGEDVCVKGRQAQTSQLRFEMLSENQEKPRSQSKSFLGEKSDEVFGKDDIRDNSVFGTVFENEKPIEISSNKNDQTKLIYNFSGCQTGVCLMNNASSIEDKLSSEQQGDLVNNEETACRLQGMVFEDDKLGTCTITNWGVDYGSLILYYAPVDSIDPAEDEQHVALEELLGLLKNATVVPKLSAYRASRRLSGFSCKTKGLIRLLAGKCLLPNCGTMRAPGKSGVVKDVKTLSTRILRKILKAHETLFKYGTMIPKSDQEAEASPEAVRWRSGRQLEWLRLVSAKTFESHWNWEKIRRAYPEYQKSEIGHMFYIYDYKYSGEHRVRLVFDGSRQSPNTYSITYAPTVRAESVRLFHLYAVEYAWNIQQYDVPQAFLRSDADCTIFVYPPKGQSEFPGQILKLSKMLYGSKQAAALWYNLLNSFLLKLGFVASTMDPCFYRRPCTVGTDPTAPRSDAIIILHVDDMRVAASPEVLKDIHAQLFAEFQITTSDSGRFLGMDTEYDLDKGVFKMHMATYIDSTVQRFANFDLSKGIPYRELVGSLLWIVLCVLGTELLRVKDLARRSNNYTMDDYKEALKALDRITTIKHMGIVFRRGGAGQEYVPACTRLGGGLEDVNEGIYSIGDQTIINELEETNLYKLDEFDDVTLDIKKVLADTNKRFTVVAYTDASFAVGDTKQSVSGFVILINGVPILWGSLKQTIVVDSTCSAEYVAASVCCKQILQSENMVQFLDFTCPRPYKLYTDSQACLKIATTASKMGMVRHLEIRYHLVRCIVLMGDIKLMYCITEEMLADLFTKIVATAQDRRLATRFYNDCVMEGDFNAEEEIMWGDLIKASDKYEAAIIIQPEAAYPSVGNR
jgi:hypothetical protein